MNKWVEYYLIFGLGAWVALCCARASTLKHASPFSILKGLAFGLFLWPFGLAVVFSIARSEYVALQGVVRTCRRILSKTIVRSMPDRDFDDLRLHIVFFEKEVD